MILTKTPWKWSWAYQELWEDTSLWHPITWSDLVPVLHSISHTFSIDVFHLNLLEWCHQTTYKGCSWSYGFWLVKTQAWAVSCWLSSVGSVAELTASLDTIRLSKSCRDRACNHPIIDPYWGWLFSIQQGGSGIQKSYHRYIWKFHWLDRPPPPPSCLIWQFPIKCLS